VSAPVSDATDTIEDRSRVFLSLPPTSECPVLWRSTDEGGYALAVYLPPAEGTRTLAHLAKCSNAHLAVLSALASLACDPPEITKEMIEAGADAISSRWLDFVYREELYWEIISEAYKAMHRAQPRFSFSTQKSGE